MPWQYDGADQQDAEKRGAAAIIGPLGGKGRPGKQRKGIGEGEDVTGIPAEKDGRALLDCEQEDGHQRAAQPEPGEADTSVEIGEQAKEGHGSGSDVPFISGIFGVAKLMVNKRLTRQLDMKT